MGLLQNGFRDAMGSLRFSGAGVSNGAYPSSLSANFARTAAMRNITAGNGITDETVGIPYGYRAPGAWMLPQKAGALSSHNVIAGAGAIADLNLAGGLNAEAALAGSGDLTGIGALIVSLVAALTGSGTISSATAQAFLNLAATLAGSGDLDGALTALAHAAAELSGDGDAAATATALGTMAASITVSGDLLTSTNVGAAVWSALAAANNEAGTMGNKLNSAASAGDPWGTTLPGAYGAGTGGFILGTYLTGDAYARLGAPAGASVSADVAAVKTKTDSLTFTEAGQVDANVQFVNDVEVTGNGQTGSEWGPA